ncbi:unannotated protein [freshwater metagenome]|uniref:Unannotated protein n=1 Tax=freshwater metagenome TaxID=449393 RepID=A0A6J7P0T3_9ZZZZ
MPLFAKGYKHRVIAGNSLLRTLTEFESTTSNGHAGGKGG